MTIKYTNDKTTQILIALLKEHGIRKVIASPGTTNMCFVASIQNDPWFQVFSSVDERSAAYIACGMSNESGEPVVITCTEATASRNYFPGLTEAYYRKLPILAITGYHNLDVIGHFQSQTIDRSQTPVDTIRESVTLDVCHDEKGEWANSIKINKAILALTHNGGGPAHINLRFPGNVGFDCQELPSVRAVKRITLNNSFPVIPKGRIAISAGAHKPWSEDLTIAVDDFCSRNNAVVFCDHTSGYKGKYGVNFTLVAAQKEYKSQLTKADLLIHIGEVSGDTYTQGALKKSRNVWRVSEDGEVKDFFHKLSYVFQMSELSFFKHYAIGEENNTYLDECRNELESISKQIPEYTFSNLWVAKTLAPLLPKNSVFHMGIFNSLRSWNMNEVDSSILSNCNVGGFGIDGAISTAFGAALVHPEKIYFCMCGDLAFFYDMNVLGNRHMLPNLRILLVNNARGTEFRNYGHPAYSLGEIADPYIAAAGHFGNQSQNLVKNYAESLGFEYMTADSKESFEHVCQKFVTSEHADCPMIFEVFTNTSDETESLKMLRTAVVSKESSIKEAIKSVVGEGALNALKKVIKK